MKASRETDWNGTKEELGPAGDLSSIGRAPIPTNCRRLGWKERGAEEERKSTKFRMKGPLERSRKPPRALGGTWPMVIEDVGSLNRSPSGRAVCLPYCPGVATAVPCRDPRLLSG